MRFSSVVQASAAVAATRSRTAKTAVLRELLATAADEVGLVVAWLSGEIPQAASESAGAPCEESMWRPSPTRSRC